MKHIIQQLNKSFESRIRLGVMSALVVNAKIDFNTLKELLDVSDGNLASHITGLEKEGYITIKKQFIGKKTNTTYQITPEGRKAFTEHLKALEQLINPKP